MNKKLIAVLLIVAISGWVYGATRPATAAYVAPETPFDHSNCQYPQRLSNPVDGCDNSDPAMPQCMKGGTETCDIPVDTTPYVPTSPAPTATPPVKNQCNG